LDRDVSYGDMENSILRGLKNNYNDE